MMNATAFKVVKRVVSLGAVVFPLANGVIKSKTMEKHGELVAKIIVKSVSKKMGKDL